MFVRKRKNKSNTTSIQIIESYRDGGKVRHKIIKHIGTASTDDQIQKLYNIGSSVKDLILQYVNEKEIDAYIQCEVSKINRDSPKFLDCDKVAEKITGIHDIYGTIIDDFKLADACDWPQAYYQAFKDIILARISNPSSKRMAVQTLAEEFGIEHPLNTVYRMMDKLDDFAIENMQECISKYVKEIIGGTVHVLFYDVTTIYFESFFADDLKKLGYSKDNKFNQPQIVLSLLVTDKGLPLGYQLFPGNTYEGHTLISAIENWQKIYSKTNFILVADSGMLNNDNLNEMDKKEISYIVCARIKNLPKTTKEEILSYKEAQAANKDFYHCIHFSKRKLIISYKLSRAQKDRYDRDKAISQLISKLEKSSNPSALISNYGYKKFINIKEQGKVVLDDIKISEAERWEGLHGLITNIKDMKAEECYHHYKNLWQVEDAFRINKSDLKIRPVFHWTPERIKAHILISYVSYACYKIVEYKINIKNNTKYSHREIKKIIKKVKISIHKDKYSENYYASPEPLTKEVLQFFSTFNKVPIKDPYCCTLQIAS